MPTVVYFDPIKFPIKNDSNPKGFSQGDTVNFDMQAWGTDGKFEATKMTKVSPPPLSSLQTLMVKSGKQIVNQVTKTSKKGTSGKTAR